MKKLFALTLAAAMVASMGATSFAVVIPGGTTNVKGTMELGEDAHKLNNGAVDGDNLVHNIINKLSYGETVYIPFAMSKYKRNAITGLDEWEHREGDPATPPNKELTICTEYEMAKGMRAKFVTEQNSDLFASAEIIKKKTTGLTPINVGDYVKPLPSGSSMYFVALTFEGLETVDQMDVSGQLTLTRSKYDDESQDYFFSLSHGSAGVNLENISDVSTIHNFDLTNESEEHELNLYGDAGRFVVNTCGQGKILLANTVEYNECLNEIYEDLNYVYINGNGATFNRTGLMYLSGYEDQFVYEVNIDGSLTFLDPKYDEYEEAFVFRTRTLGDYIISNDEINVADALYSGDCILPDEEANVDNTLPSDTIAPEIVDPINPGTGVCA